MAIDDPARRLASWIGRTQDCVIEDGLSPTELDRAEQWLGLAFPSLWREVLAIVHPVAVPRPPRGPDGVLRWTRFPDWRLRDEEMTNFVVELPIDGLLFDVESNGFWWTAWGEAPREVAARVELAGRMLVQVPKLIPIWGHRYVSDVPGAPVFSIVQSDLYVPALTLEDMATGRSQDGLPVEGYPIGDVPFWSLLHGWSQVGHIDPALGALATSGDGEGDLNERGGRLSLRDLLLDGHVGDRDRGPGPGPVRSISHLKDERLRPPGELAASTTPRTTWPARPGSSDVTSTVAVVASVTMFSTASSHAASALLRAATPLSPGAPRGCRPARPARRAATTHADPSAAGSRGTGARPGPVL